MPTNAPTAAFDTVADAIATVSHIAINSHPPGIHPRWGPSHSPRDNGPLIRDVLAGAWRKQVPKLEIDAARIAAVTPLLVFSGAGALGWRRVATAEAATSAEAQELRGIARRLVLDEVLRTDALRQIAAILNEAGVVPMLVKGWGAARYYAEPHLRPYGDYDLLVAPGQFESAHAALNARAIRPSSGETIAVDCEPRNRLHWVDLHDRLAPVYQLPLAQLLEHAELVVFADGSRLMVPSHEDHLRLVTLHFFKHGGCRPLWLCDIAALTEAAGPKFDWDRCLGSHAVARSWVAAGIGTAYRMLGARIDHVPERAWRHPPAWLVDTILHEWRAPYALRHNARRGDALSDPAFWLAARWPNAAYAMFNRGQNVSSRTKLPHQVAHFVMDSGLRGLANFANPNWWATRDNRKVRC